jgi:hypothetical protein
LQILKGNRASSMAKVAQTAQNGSKMPLTAQKKVHTKGKRISKNNVQGIAHLQESKLTKCMLNWAH